MTSVYRLKSQFAFAGLEEEKKCGRLDRVQSEINSELYDLRMIPRQFVKVMAELISKLTYTFNAP